LDNLAACFQTVHNRHPDVQQCHIRPHFCSFRHGFASVSRLSYHLPSRLDFKQGAHSGPKDFVVIRYQQP
jgi:hypothetical protein